MLRGRDRWDRWYCRHFCRLLVGLMGGTTMKDCRSARAARALRTPVPPVPPASTTCSHQILWSTTGTTGPTGEMVQGTNEDGIAHHADGSFGPVPTASSIILGSST